MTLDYSNFINQVNKFNFIEKNAKIAVGVSGGIDSLSLAILLSKWAKINNYKIIALIVDHKLRSESSIEARKVSLYLSSLNIENKILVWNSDHNRSSIQERARLARLEIIQKFCSKNNIIHLFLGHHFDDNLETFAMRKLAGSDIEGLNAINNISLNSNIIILRPLLNFTKKEIIKFGKKNNLNWIEDPSNDKMMFSRIKIRKIILQNQKIAIHLKKEMKEYKFLYDGYIEMINMSFVKVLIFVTDRYIELDKNLFCNLPKEIACKILVKSVKHLNKDAKKFKYHKLLGIYDNLLKKIGEFQTQKTLFINTKEKIIISLANKYN